MPEGKNMNCSKSFHEHPPPEVPKLKICTYKTVIGRQPQMEEDLNGRQPQWKTASMEDSLNGRQPQWKTEDLI